MVHSFRPYPAVAIVKLLLIAVFVSVMLFILRESIAQYLLTVLILLWLITLFYMLVAYLRSMFHVIELEDKVLTYRSGIISTRKIVIPYAKITEASYTQSLLQRIFGVGNLNVDTAGGSMVAIHLNDVKYSDIKMILGDINKKGGQDEGF
jgi:uncharacterized membrane protein YdbT with pleckstrin-like domain